MRILLITAYFPPEVGSASHLYHDLGTALLDLGHEVTVLTGMPGYHVRGDQTRYRRKLWMREEMDGLQVVRVATPRLPRRLMFGRAVWQFSSALASLSAGALLPRHDSAIVYSPPLPLGLTAWAIRLLRGTPFVLNVQDLFPQSVIDLGLLKDRRLIRAFESLERWLYARADAITVHSEANASHVIARAAGSGACHGSNSPPPRGLEAGERKVVVMHNWVDTDEIHPSGPGSEFRARYGLGGDFVVSFGGVLAYSQDLDVVLDAAELLRQHTDIQWVIAGDGVERERLSAKAKGMGLDNVRFLGMLPREEYPQLLFASDACLATLRGELKTPVVPSKILSIMAAGRPVIAVMDPDGDAPRLVRDAACGCTLPAGDARALAGAVLRLRADPGLRRQLGASGRAYAEKHLSLRQAARRYEALLFHMTREAVSSAQRA